MDFDSAEQSICQMGFTDSPCADKAFGHAELSDLPPATVAFLTSVPRFSLIFHDSPSAQLCAALRVLHCVSPFGARSVMGRRRRTSQQSKEAASFGDTMHFANLLMERSDFLFSKLTTYLYSPSPYSGEGYGLCRTGCLLSLSPSRSSPAARASAARPSCR